MNARESRPSERRSEHRELSPRRPHPLPVAVLGTLLPALLAAQVCPAAERHAVAAKTNFLIILCDDLGYGDLGCFGHKAIKTPCLDRLADEGMRLTNCYASAPVCSPSRAGMLTGRTPYRCGIYDWIPENSPVHLRRSEVTVASLLKSAGYATCHVGKWHCNGKFNSPEQPQPGDHGFDYWFSTQNNALPSHRNPVNFARNGAEVGPLQGYSSTLIVEEAIRWLKGREAGKPFCLFVWFHSPHEPVATAENFVKMYPQATRPEEAIYWGNVTQMDHETGRLLKTLDDLKLRENTLVLFTSDNGPEYRAKHSFGLAGPLRGKKLHMYEGGIREPGIIRFPGKTRPGQVCDEPVINLDLLPTLCEIAGVKSPADRRIDGSSFLPIFDGKPIVRKRPLYWQYDLAQGGPKIAIRDGDWKLLAMADMKTFELYNLKSDPAESDNQAAKEPDRVKAMAETMTELYREINAEGPKWPLGTRKMPKRAFAKEKD